MSPALWMAGVATASLALSLATAWYAWWSSRQRATQRELEVLRVKFDDEREARRKGIGELRDKMAGLEAAISNLPNHNQISELQQDVHEVRGGVTGLRDMVGLLGKNIDRINDFLMSEKKQ